MSSAPSLRFKTEEIREKQGLCARLELPPELLLGGSVEDARLAGPVAVELEFLVGGSQILMQARLTGAWLVACSRCLREGHAPFEARAEETYPATAETLSPQPELREAALLELPQRWVCPGCPGFRAEWGQKPPADAPATPSPFDVLKKLKKKDK